MNTEYTYNQSGGPFLQYLLTNSKVTALQLEPETPNPKKHKVRSSNRRASGFVCGALGLGPRT